MLLLCRDFRVAIGARMMFASTQEAFLHAIAQSSENAFLLDPMPAKRPIRYTHAMSILGDTEDGSVYHYLYVQKDDGQIVACSILNREAVGQTTLLRSLMTSVHEDYRRKRLSKALLFRTMFHAAVHGDTMAFGGFLVEGKKYLAPTIFSIHKQYFPNLPVLTDDGIVVSSLSSPSQLYE